MTAFSTDGFEASDASAGPTEPDLIPGQRVGEYEVDGKLGQGAFGSVFRAVHPLIGKVVAIKVLARKFSVDPEMVSRFIAEARAVNQIRHRHIIDIFSFGQLEDGRHYYVMEHIDGEPLDAAIERDGRLRLAEALPILRAIGRALDAAHTKGIAHRDLKAENVFLGRDPDGAVFPKLLDFGIAKLLAPEDGVKHKTRTGTPVGTPYYMSPEQCRGRDVDHRTDLYAFGVLAYLMLTGKYPLDADDYLSVLIRQMADTPAPASSLAPELPKGVDDALAWLMAKEPAQRPPSLRAALLAIEAAAAGAGVTMPSWEVASGPHGQLGQLGTQPLPAAVPRASGAAVAAAAGSGLGDAAAAAAMAAAAAQPRSRARRMVALVAALALVAGGAATAITVMLRGAGEGPALAAVVASPAAAGPAAAGPAAAGAGVGAAVGAGAGSAASSGSAQPAIGDHVIITVTGVPDGTDVLIGGATVGVAPGPVQLERGDRPVVLTFKAPGYFPASRTVTPDGDHPLAVQLKQRPATGAPRRPAKDDIIEAFPTRIP
jgi:serine/threonine-protein kinase